MIAYHFSCHWERGGVHPGQTRCTLTPRYNLPINLSTCMFLDGGRKLEYPERIHTHTGRTCKLHTECPQLGFEPGTLLLLSEGANHHTTLQPLVKNNCGKSLTKNIQNSKLLHDISNRKKTEMMQPCKF